MKWPEIIVHMILGTLVFSIGFLTHRQLAPTKTITITAPAVPLYEIEQKCRAQVRKEAAEAGVAFYELNQKTGEIEFHYVDIQRVIQQVAQQMQQRMQQVSPLQ